MKNLIKILLTAFVIVMLVTVCSAGSLDSITIDDVEFKNNLSQNGTILAKVYFTATAGVNQLTVMLVPEGVDDSDVPVDKIIYLNQFDAPENGVLEFLVVKDKVLSATGKDTIVGAKLVLKLGGTNVENASKKAVMLDSSADYKIGDIDGNGNIDIDDAILLFQFSLLPDLYPVEYTGNLDFDKNNSVDLDDAILVFQHSLLPDLYPLG